jgi:hypothetical protein
LDELMGGDETDSNSPAAAPGMSIEDTGEEEVDDPGEDDTGITQDEDED